MEDKVRSSKAERKIIFHKLSFARVICGLEKEYGYEDDAFINLLPLEKFYSNQSKKVTCSPASHPAWPTTAEVFTRGPPRFRS